MRFLGKLKGIGRRAPCPLPRKSPSSKRRPSRRPAGLGRRCAMQGWHAKHCCFPNDECALVAFGLGGACGFSRRDLFRRYLCAKAGKAVSFSSTLIPSDRQPSSTSPASLEGESLVASHRRLSAGRAEGRTFRSLHFGLEPRRRWGAGDKHRAGVPTVDSGCAPGQPGTVAEVVTAFRAGAAEFLPGRSTMTWL